MTKEVILQDILQFSPDSTEYPYMERMMSTITNMNVAKVTDSRVSITLYHHYDEMHEHTRDIDIPYEQFFKQVVNAFDW